MLVRFLLIGEHSSLRKRIREIITDPHVLFVSKGTKTKAELWSALSRQPFDLAMIKKEALPEAIEDLICTVRELPEHPEVIVISSREDPEERAKLLAAGCYAVIYERLSDNAMGAALDALIARRRDEVTGALRTERFKFRASLQDFVSSSQAMQSFMSMVYRVVPTDSSLYSGAVGCGSPCVRAVA